MYYCRVLQVVNNDNRKGRSPTRNGPGCIDCVTFIQGFDAPATNPNGNSQAQLGRHNVGVDFS